MMRPTAKILPRGVPDCLKKRRLLNERQLSPALCREYAGKYLALSWWEDALEFFQKGNEPQGLEKIKSHCLETGDAYLLGRLGKNHPPQLWRQVADQALSLGKLHFARRAFKMAGDADRAAAVERLLASETLEP